MWRRQGGRLDRGRKAPVRSPPVAFSRVSGGTMPTIAVTRERRAGETRVAAVPETVKKLIGQGFAVVVEAGAGAAAAYPDADYQAAGATIAKTAKDALAKADILLKVRAPEPDEIAVIKPGTLV